MHRSIVYSNRVSFVGVGVDNLLNFVQKSLMLDLYGSSLSAELSPEALAQHQQELFTQVLHES